MNFYGMKEPKNDADLIMDGKSDKIISNTNEVFDNDAIGKKRDVNHGIYIYKYIQFTIRIEIVNEGFRIPY